MKNKKCAIILTCIIALSAFGCAGSKYGSAKQNEKVLMASHIKHNVINYAALKDQGKPENLASRGAPTRGLVSSYEGGLLSYGVAAVKVLIANSNKKYTDGWSQGLNDLYFYDQPSTDGPFDPVGLQFYGFNIKRLVKADKHDRDSLLAVAADFELDTTNYNEIINNSVFRLKLKSITVNYAKPKVPAKDNYINLDFEITFTTSYVNKEGQLFKAVELGKFYYSLRHAPLDSTTKAYKQYYLRLANTPVTGTSFIVPRSYGYYKNNNNIYSYYNQGVFSIAVKVTESSKNNFVNKMLINTSGIAIDYGTGMAQKKIGVPIAPVTVPVATPSPKN